MLQDRVNAVMRCIPDFPVKGVLFRDITPIFLDPKLCGEIAEALAVQATRHTRVDAVAGIESRGLLFGVLMAQKLGVPFHIIRKKGKLPGETVEHTYNLEYGTATIEVHKGFIKPNENVLIHDDVLATGGTAKAAANLIAQENGMVAGYSFLIELNALNGRKLLETIQPNIFSLLRYD